MAGTHSGELVFTVNGSTATQVKGVDIAALGLTERAHLQEWVLANPEILGPDVMIVTFEFDRWLGGAGPQGDRLDVLGLGRDGRLVVAELKRGRAPDTVDTQAIKYAAMASRFDELTLAEHHLRFLLDRGERLTDAQALDKLTTHSTVGLTPDLLSSPRIVLLAESFSQLVISSVVWLNRQGVDITLIQYKAYQTGSGETLVTVSQFYPVVDTADIVIGPRSGGAPRVKAEAPEVPWTSTELAQLAGIGNLATLTVLDLCAERPGQWVGARDVVERAGIAQESFVGQLGGFSLTLRSRFGRANPPYEKQWIAGTQNQSCYRLTSATASDWLAIRAEEDSGSADGLANAPTDGIGEPTI